MPKHVTSQGALPAPVQQNISCREKKGAVAYQSSPSLPGLVIRLRFPHIKNASKKDVYFLLPADKGGLLLCLTCACDAISASVEEEHLLRLF